MTRLKRPQYIQSLRVGAHLATTGEEDGRRAERTTRKQTHGRVSVHTAAGSTGQAQLGRPRHNPCHGRTCRRGRPLPPVRRGPCRRCTCHPCPRRQASKLHVVNLLAAASLVAAATAEGTKVYRNVTGSKIPGGAGTHTNVTGSKTPGGAGTHTRHVTGRVRAPNHVREFTNEPQKENRVRKNNTSRF